jgi:hypothetical protein
MYGTMYDTSKTHDTHPFQKKILISSSQELDIHSAQHLAPAFLLLASVFILASAFNSNIFLVQLPLVYCCLPKHSNWLNDYFICIQILITTSSFPFVVISRGSVRILTSISSTLNLSHHMSMVQLYHSLRRCQCAHFFRFETSDCTIKNLVNLPAPFPESGCHTQSRCGEGPTARSEANHYN